VAATGVRHFSAPGAPPQTPLLTRRRGQLQPGRASPTDTLLVEAAANVVKLVRSHRKGDFL
jgi:hypothetical protein